jgi:hypothetical protein
VWSGQERYRILNPPVERHATAAVQHGVVSILGSHYAHFIDKGSAMGKGLRLSEKWYKRGLWLVALVFASFLIGLGGQVVSNMRLIEPAPELEQFIDPVQGPQVKARLEQARLASQSANDQLEQARLAHSSAAATVRSQREAFDNWLATRSATQRSDQDPELIKRTRTLDELVAGERSALLAVEAQEKKQLDASQAYEAAARDWERLSAPAQEKMEVQMRKSELKVFLYRLALTLPLLVLAAWLFVKKRKGIYWPFVWGYIIFAGFAFFVELVPYLPSYGGYVRYTVGIILTAVIGRYAILGLQRYLEKQKAEESLPENQRRETLEYDTALTRMGKGVCPGCERPVDVKDPTIDFCQHCGINLFDRCVKCTTRKNAFAHYCFSCGTASSRTTIAQAQTKN